MKQIIVFLLFSIILQAQFIQKTDGVYVNTITVKVKPEYLNSEIKKKDIYSGEEIFTNSKTSNVFQKYGNKRIRKSFTQEENESKSSVTDKIGLDRFYEIEFEKPVKMWETIYELRESGMFEYVDPPVIAVPEVEPNDYNSSNPAMWYFNKIDIFNAWNITTGSSTIKVAVVEPGGVNITHADINDKIDGGESTYDASNNHGLNVAGILAAETNNSTGIPGIGWNTKIIPYNTSNGSSVHQDINSAKNTSHIINCSFRTLNVDPNDNTKYINYSYPLVSAAIESAIENGVIVVASGGNPPDVWNGLSPSEYPPYTSYPASYDGVIAVSATNSSDVLGTNYNYGTQIDISAPGIDVYTLTGTSSGTSFADCRRLCSSGSGGIS